jgi:hypothetical protein
MGAPSRIHRHVAGVFLGLGFLAVLALGLGAGCSSSSSAGGNSPCGSPCASGTTCLDDGSGQSSACRQVCTSSAQCPFNTTCNDAQPQSWCAPNTLALPQLPSGQWGASCLPAGGEANNPSCDVADGFACYGASPTDATAFCTLFGCEFDTDCPGTWWCARENQGPNVRSSKSTFGITRAVCLPRAYCAPCHLDHDCPKATDGTPQHCVIDATSAASAGFCAPACGTDGNCAVDATCQNWQSLCTPGQGPSCQSDDDCPALSGVAQHCDAGKCAPECAADSDCDGPGANGVPAKCQWARVCTPRAGTCLGDGGFCSPCRSDADCKNGYCLSGLPYSTERFCSLKSTAASCDPTVANPAGCPAHATKDNWLLNVCTTAPADQCEGLVALGTSTGQVSELPGCWTVNR